MSDDETVRTPNKRTAIKLNPLPRWVLGVIGAAGRGGGSVAVFTRDVEAGPVAMVGVGAFFFVMGLVGLMPTRLKIGDNEAEWSAVQEFIAEQVDDAKPDERPELIRLLAELSKAAPEATGPAFEAMTYDATIREMVRQIAHDVRPQVTTESQVLLGRREAFDMYVTGPQGRRIAIEIKFRPQKTRAYYVELHHRFTELRERQNLETLLIVSPTRVSLSLQDVLSTYNDLRFIAVGGYEDLPFLRQTIGELVGPLEN